jgi:endonuclease/exonuclease/phosphatase family metal-dependent hydrolase
LWSPAWRATSRDRVVVDSCDRKIKHLSGLHTVCRISRLVVAYGSGVRLRVLTYNIRSGTDILGRPRLGDQATVVRKAAADLVLLQEVAGDRQAEQFADIAGLRHVAFGATRRTRTGEFGNAMLCRWPLREIRNQSVSGSWRTGQARALLEAKLVWDMQRVHAIATHFGLLPGEAETAAHAILARAAGFGGPLLVGGDFNQPRANAACHRLLRTAFNDTARQSGRAHEPTFPAPRPFLRLDYLYLRGLVQEVTVVPSSASDHRAVLATIELATVCPG